MVRGLMFHTSVTWALLLSTSPVWQPMGQAVTVLGYMLRSVALRVGHGQAVVLRDVVIQPAEKLSVRGRLLQAGVEVILGYSLDHVRRSEPTNGPPGI